MSRCFENLVSALSAVKRNKPTLHYFADQEVIYGKHSEVPWSGKPGPSCSEDALQTGAVCASTRKAFLNDASVDPGEAAGEPASIDEASGETASGYVSTCKAAGCDPSAGEAASSHASARETPHKAPNKAPGGYASADHDQAAGDHDSAAIQGLALPRS